jgi:hypothetical protein
MRPSPEGYEGCAVSGLSLKIAPVFPDQIMLAIAVRMPTPPEGDAQNDGGLAVRFPASGVGDARPNLRCHRRAAW